MSLNKLFQFFADASQASTPGPKVAGVTRHTLPSANVMRNGVRHVRRDTTPLIQQRGWTQRGNAWHGHFVTHLATFPGRIEKRGDRLIVEIKSPPAEIKKHSKWVCFHKRGAGWWEVHLHRQPADADPSAIVRYIERILTESYKL